MQNIRNNRIPCPFSSKEDEDFFDLPVCCSWGRKVLVTQNESERCSVVSDSSRPPWSVACQAPLSGFPQARILE